MPEEAETTPSGKVGQARDKQLSSALRPREQGGEARAIKLLLEELR